MHASYVIKKQVTVVIILLIFGINIIPCSQSTCIHDTAGTIAIQEMINNNEGKWRYNPSFVYVNAVYNLSTPGWGYTHFNSIQAGIDAVEYNGTVFVFNGTYSENIHVNKSLYLLGENKYSTILEGTITDGNGVNISADYVTIRTFTIQNFISGFGIFILKNFIRVTDSIISNNMGGIQIYYDPYESASTDYGFNIIDNNRFFGNEAFGIGLTGKNSTIIGNSISQSQFGVILVCGDSNNISSNIITENEHGIFNTISYSTMIYRNTFLQNKKLGVSNFCTSASVVRQNTFIGNGQQAYFNEPLQARFRLLKIIFDFPLRPSIWDQNYWNQSQTLFYRIPGLVSFFRGPTIESPFIHNCFQFDWHPAQEPYGS